MFTFQFKPWGKFWPFYDKKAVREFLRTGSKIALKRLKDGLKNPPKTGRKYRRNGRLHQASVNRALAEYPAKDTGRLFQSASKRVSATEFEIGTGMFYSRFLRDGTKKMRRRKMSDTALKESIPEIRKNLRRFAYWKR